MTDANAMPKPGQAAPDFSLAAGPDQQMSLSDLRGAPAILAFYPADWSPVCSDEMALYQAVLPQFEQYGAAMVGISVDSVWCHRAFADSRGIAFPLLADFQPKGTVSSRYGVYDTRDGVSERALFVIDDLGVVTWSHLSPRGVNPGADGVIAALETLEATREVAS
jgi:peroxiredoxin